MIEPYCIAVKTTEALISLIYLVVQVSDGQSVFNVCLLFMAAEGEEGL